eukprot:4156795-Prymnesium_polylepis.2
MPSSSLSSLSLSSLLSSLPSSLLSPPASSAAGGFARCLRVAPLRVARGWRCWPVVRCFLPKPSALSLATSAASVGSCSPPSTRLATSLVTSASSSGRKSASLPERRTETPSRKCRNASCTETCLAVNSLIAPTHRTSRPSLRILAKAANTPAFFSSLTRNCSSSSFARNVGSFSRYSRAVSWCSVSLRSRPLRIASCSTARLSAALQPSISSPPPPFLTCIAHLTMASRAPTRSCVPSTLVR